MTILKITAPNGRTVNIDTEENPHTCIRDESFPCIACIAQSMYVTPADKSPDQFLTEMEQS